MKLLYLTHEDINRTSVAKAMMYDIAKKLSNKYDVSVVSASEERRRSKRFFKDGDVNNIKFFRSVYGSVSVADIFRLFCFSFIILYHIIKNDVIYVRSYPMMVFGVFAKVFRKKLIFDPRGLGFLEMIDSGNVGTFFSDKILFKIERFFISCSDAVVCVSESHSEYYEKNYGQNEKYIVIYNGTEEISEIDILDKSGEDLVKIVYVGSLIKWHCPERVNSILNSLYEIGCNFEFHCITKDILNAKKIFSGQYEVKIYSHLYRQNPIKFDLGMCLIADSLSKSACFPVKFSEYIASQTPVLFSTNVDVCTKISKEFNIGIGVSLGCDDDVIAKVILSYLDGMNSNERITLPYILTQESMILEIDKVICSLFKTI